MVLDEITSFISDWKFSMAVVPLFLLAIAPTTEAAYDFSVYRMHQYDVEKNPSGSRSSMVSFEGRTAASQQIGRKNVLIKIEDLTPSLFQSVMAKSPGAILILLPEFIQKEDFMNITQERLNKIHEAEKILLEAPQSAIPIYFTFEDAAMRSIYSEIENSSELFGSAAILNAGSTVLHQFTVAGKQPEPLKKQLNVLESRLAGSGTDNKIVLITSRMDAFASSFALAKGANSAGSGTGVLLEIARMIKIIYGEDSNRPKVTVMFALMPADGFNFMSTKDWLDSFDKYHGENSEIDLRKIELAICLDGLAARTDGKLYVHVSLPPKEGTTSRRFLDALRAAGAENGVEVVLVHSRINRADERRYWQHEQFSFKKVPAMTVSSLPTSDLAIRNSMTDVFGRVSQKDFRNAVSLIGDAVLSTIYESEAVTGGLSLNFDAVNAWAKQLSANPRSATNTTSRLTNDVEKHLKHFTDPGAFERRRVCDDLTLYSNDRAVMSTFLVRPALFDLYLAALVGCYLGGLFLAIEHFTEILFFLSPLLAKPELIRKQKVL